MLSFAIDLSESLLPSKLCEGEHYSENDLVKIEVIGEIDRKDMKEQFVPNTLILNFKCIDQLKIGSVDHALQYSTMLSNLLTAAFGTPIAPAKLIQYDGSPIYRSPHRGITAQSFSNGLLEGRHSLGSCVGFTIDNIAELAKDLVLSEKWSVTPLSNLERASMFYAEAIVASRHSAGVSYSLLLSSLECLASAKSISTEELIDPEDLELIRSLEGHPDFGPKIASRIRSRFYQLKRRCIAVALSSYDEKCYFLDQANSQKDANRKVEFKDWSKRISASYDLRSAYMHSGNEGIDTALSWWKTDYQKFRSIINDKKTLKLIKNAFNIYQLNGIVQHCLSYSIREALSPNQLQKPNIWNYISTT
jgi:hypothetical protein|tara:strand:+ start:60 stop:1145 length:1086 start_codon:yes stop_codon:yes gene_type:complete